MKYIDIAPIVDKISNIIDVKTGPVHVSRKDADVLRLYKDDEKIGTLSKLNGKWRFSAQVKSQGGYAYGLEFEEASDVVSILKELRENF